MGYRRIYFFLQNRLYLFILCRTVLETFVLQPVSSYFAEIDIAVHYVVVVDDVLVFANNASVFAYNRVT